MIDIFAYIGGIAGMVAFVPQIWKAVTTRSTGDLSWMMLATMLISGIAYEVYAIGLELTPVVVMNGIFVLTTAALAATKVYFDRNPELAFVEAD